jgi:cytochrome c oxidase subunit 2
MPGARRWVGARLGGVAGRIVGWALGLGGIGLLGGCGARTSVLSPAGPGAAHIATLWWVMLALGTVIFAGVLTLLLLALFRRRDDRAGPADGRRFIIGGGIVLPVAVLTALFSLTIWTMSALAAREPELTVRVTGWQWWWEVHYPAEGFYTANELVIPAGRPVRVELASGDVVHNLWVPELHGKFDLIPGHIHSFTIEADQPGEFQGMCAEYCGEQHAKMRFVVVALTPAEFAAWAAAQAAPAPQPSDPLLLRGQQIFLGSACVYCHAVSGTNANSRFGPDLTHLASRRTLAAGVLPNTRGNLAGWITNPQTIKPGNKMPPVVLESEELNALIAYLESLE